jgi:acyl carrier protein
MIPATFVLLEAMPLTAHGKVNRHALPTPPAFHEESGATPMKPHTTLEQTIAAIWQEVLHINEISIYDNFFDLGGHSLLVVLMGSKLQETLEIDISILDLFDHPTINSLATYLQEGARNSHAPRQERKNTLKKHRADKQKRRTVQK